MCYSSALTIICSIALAVCHTGSGESPTVNIFRDNAWLSERWTRRMSDLLTVARVTSSELLHEWELEWERVSGGFRDANQSLKASRGIYNQQEHRWALEWVRMGGGWSSCCNRRRGGFDSWVDARGMDVVVKDDYIGKEIAVPVAGSETNGRHLKLSIVVSWRMFEIKI